MKNNQVLEEKKVLVAIKKSTHAKLSQLGNVSMTRDDVINSLIDFWNKYKDVVKERK